MGNPIFRFTLQHDETGSLEISEPSGWMDAKLVLERHEDFHSLVEYFKADLVFYGTNGVDNGGIDRIKYIEQHYGPDATINIHIEVSFDSAKTYESIFRGQLDLSNSTTLKDNRMLIPIIRDDFWAKFISRKDIPIDLSSDTDLDGNGITPIPPIRMYLPSQKIRYAGRYKWTDTVTYEGMLGYFGLQLDWDERVIDDIKLFTLSRVPIDIGNIAGQAQNLIGNFEAPWDGDYALDIRIEAGEYGAGNWFTTNMNIWVQNPNQINETDPFTQTNVTYGANVISVYTYNKSLRLRKGDQITIFGHRAAASDNITIFGNNRLTWLPDVDLATNSNVTLSGEQTIDGVLTSASRVLVKGQGATEENGIYVTSAGVWSRATDANQASELLNAAVFVTAGNLHANTAWKQDETEIALGSTPVTWVYTFPSDERFLAYPGSSVDNHFSIDADTTFKSSQAEGYLLHDAAAGILQGYGL